MWAVDITTEPSFSAGNPRELFKGAYKAFSPVRGFAVSPDGKKFLMVKLGPQLDTPVTHLNVTLNWFEELNRLVPTE